MLASSACAVQMLDVAFSRRMCCSRVCSAMRYARLPCASTDTPMMRPGACRTCFSRVAKNAACGPPYPIGTPNRCELPNDDVGAHLARRRQQREAEQIGADGDQRRPRACASRDEPAQVVHAPGLVRRLHQRAEHPIVEGRRRRDRRRRARCRAARPGRAARRSSAGSTSRRRRTAARPPAPSIRLPCTRCSIVIASAAAVASSSSDAFATSMPGQIARPSSGS